MDIKHLKIFLQIYNQMNITKAAQDLFMTQPAVSRSLIELEHYYGIKLFERINHQLTPTVAGKELYFQSAQIINAFNDMEKRIFDWNESGQIRIGASIIPGIFVVPKIISDYQKEYPKLVITIRVANAATLFEQLLSNKLDFAVIEGRVDNAKFKSDPLYDSRMLLIMNTKNKLAKQKSIKISDLNNCNFLLRELGSGGRKYTEYIFEKHNISINPIMESNSINAIISGVALNLGIAIIAEDQFRLIKSKNIIAVKIKDEDFLRHNYLVSHKDKIFTKTEERLRNFFIIKAK